MGWTGFIAREWVEISGWRKNKIEVWVAETWENPETISCHSRISRRLVFPTTFLAKMFKARYDNGQYERCRKMIKKYCNKS